MTLPTEIRDDVAHDLLGLAAGVDLGGVEEVDPCFVGGLHTRRTLLDI
jgi:hypothetical protein